MFGNGYIDYWEGRCPLSGFAVVEFLRANHIKRWADCEPNAKRLDVFNGLLLIPRLDAALDRGFATFDYEDRAVLAHSLDVTGRAMLGFDGPRQAAMLTDSHRGDLNWH